MEYNYISKKMSYIFINRIWNSRLNSDKQDNKMDNPQK